MSKWKIVLFITMILLITLYLMYDKKSDEVFNENKTLKKESIEAYKDDTVVKKYKDVFKEKHEISKLKVIEDEQEIKNIDDESQSAIEEAEQLIHENNLVLPVKEVSKEEKQKLEKLEKELNETKQKLEELSNEN